MKYSNPIVKAKFIKRHNRFVAEVSLEGENILVHVKNTGRCGEIFLPGVVVYLEDSGNPARKYRYSLIAAEKGSTLINVDSQAPNKVAFEYLRDRFGFDYIKPEYTYGKSRLDFYAEKGGERYLIEVKGVTLEHEDLVSFPDAPTQRGCKHLRELIKAKGEGYRAMVLFIVQMKGVYLFTPNEKNDPKFALTLREASEKGVEIYAVDCIVTPDSLIADKEVKIKV